MGKIILYKAVRKQHDIYFSDYNNNYQYKIGEIHESTLDMDINNRLGKGLHVTTLRKSINFGEGWENIAILECEINEEDLLVINDPIMGICYRTRKLKVLREIQQEYRI